MQFYASLGIGQTLEFRNQQQHWNEAGKKRAEWPTALSSSRRLFFADCFQGKKALSGVRAIQA